MAEGSNEAGPTARPPKARGRKPQAFQQLEGLSLSSTMAYRSRARSSGIGERCEDEPSTFLDTKRNKMYIHTIVDELIHNLHRANALFPLPCACQNLRRLTRLVTRIYDQELRKAEIEITQFGLLTALGIAGEANQKALSAGFAMDSTTLTRTLALLRRQGWIHVRPGKDKRERVFRLTEAGKRQVAAAQPHWQAAEHRLRKTLGPVDWKQMQATVARVTGAATEA